MTPRWAASISDLAVLMASLSTTFLTVWLTVISKLSDSLLIEFREDSPSAIVTSSIATKLPINFVPIVIFDPIRFPLLQYGFDAVDFLAGEDFIDVQQDFHVALDLGHAEDIAGFDVRAKIGRVFDIA